MQDARCAIRIRPCGRTGRSPVFMLHLLTAMLGLGMAFAAAAGGAGVGATLKAGTTGFGADATVALHEKVNLRAGFNGFTLTAKPDVDEEEDDENITVELTLQTIPILLDWHPFAGNFRLTGGVVINNNEVGLSAAPGDTLDFNDVEYRVDSFTMDLKFNRFSPYLGIGYGNAARGRRRLVFALDAGLMYHGTPDLTARATAANPSQQGALDRDIEVEIADMKEDLRPFVVYPVLTVGLSYRF